MELNFVIVYETYSNRNFSLEGYELVPVTETGLEDGIRGFFMETSLNSECIIAENVHLDSYVSRLF